MNVSDKSAIFQKLKDATILNYLSDLNLDYEIHRYDSLVNHLFHGDFDDILVRSLPFLKSIDVEDREDILSTAKDYSHFCFFDGSIDNWVNSIEKLPVDDYDFTAYQLFEQYVFLIDLVSSVSMSQLEKISDIISHLSVSDLSVIETLRVCFLNDELLKDTLIDMTDENSSYSLFSDQEKALLLSYPRDNIFSVSTMEKIDPTTIAINIYNDMNHTDIKESDFLQGSDIKEKILTSFKDEQKFKDVVIQRFLQSDLH